MDPDDNPCNICSSSDSPVFHEHNSSRGVRLLQGVEFSDSNRPYWCTTCGSSHPARPDSILNLCLSSRQLHNIHTPRTGVLRADPDPIHIDYLSLNKGPTRHLDIAFEKEYGNEERPMRILVITGADDFLAGKSVVDIIEDFMRLRMTIDKLNRFHPDRKNEVVFATVINSPKLCWLKDNPKAPSGHKNMLRDIEELNSWIVKCNRIKGHSCTPRFHRFGVKNTTQKDKNGKKVHVHQHIFKKWDPSVRNAERVDLSMSTKIQLSSHTLKLLELILSSLL